MTELIEPRALGAIRWVDAISETPIVTPMRVTSDDLRLVRNLGGLCVITHARGLEHYTEPSDRVRLPPSDSVPLGSLVRSGTVEDPTGKYMPARFTIRLPRDGSPTVLHPGIRRPPDSLFTPIDIPLLPSPSAKLPPGYAQVRVLIHDADGKPLRNALARVVTQSGDRVLGLGLADSRGEAVVAIPGLDSLEAATSEGETADSETEGRLEIVLPPIGAEEVVDWTELKNQPVGEGQTDPEPLTLRPGVLHTRRFPFVPFRESCELASACAAPLHP